MEKNRNHINKDIHYFCKMRPIQSIFGIAFTSSSDELEWFECYVDEERYKVEDKVRIRCFSFVTTVTQIDYDKNTATVTWTDDEGNVHSQTDSIDEYVKIV